MSRILIKQINSSAATTGATIILDTTGKNVWTNQSTGALLLPAGSTAQEPSSPTAGMFRYNTNTTLIEYYDGIIWKSEVETAIIAEEFIPGSSLLAGFAVTIDATTGLWSPGMGSFSTTAGGKEVLRFNTASGAVNHFEITPSATTQPLLISAVGSDTNIALSLTTKGIGNVLIPNGTLQVQSMASYGIVHTDINGAMTTSLLDTDDFVTNTLTYPKLQQETAKTILGNPMVSTSNVQEISMGATLTLTGGQLQTLAMSGDVTTPANSFVTTISAGAVTSSKMASGAAAANVGSLGGDLSGTLPNPTVVTYNGGTTFGTMAHENSNSVSITGGSITGLPTPVNNSDAATKQYVDSVVSGLNYHEPVQVATTANLTATYTAGTLGADGGYGVGATLTNAGTQTALVIDGYSVSVSDRVLVKDQTTQTQNGIYVVSNVGTVSTNWVLTRASDYDNHSNPSDIDPGDLVPVLDGTVNIGTIWIETAPSPIVVGTNNIIFGKFSGGFPTLTFTGDVTGTGGITTALTIANNAVTYSKFQQVAADSLVGNPTGSSANAQEITLGSTLSFVGSTLETNALTGDITTSANSFVTTIANNAVTNAKFRQSNGLSVVGNPTNATANVIDITASGANQVLITNSAGTAVSWGTVATAAIANNAVTYAKIQTETASTLLGNPGVTTAVPSEITLGATLTFVGSSLRTVAQTGDVTTAANSFVTTLATVNSNIGTFNSVTVNAKGLVTAASNTSIVNSFTGDGIVLSNSASTGAVTATLAMAPAKSLLGNSSGISATPSYQTSPVVSGSITSASHILAGSTSGLISILPQAAAGTYNFNLPTTAGTAGQVLTSQGGSSSAMTWTSPLTLQLYKENPVTPLSNTVSGNNAVAIGEGQTASGQDSITLGGANNISSATYSASMGMGANANLYGQVAHSNGNFATAGDAQASQYVLRNKTNGNTSSELFLDGSSARLVMQDNSAWIFKVYVIARRSDATGDYGAWEISGIIKRDTGVATTALVGKPIITKLSTTNNQININIVANSVQGALKISASNTDATKSYNWVARVDTTEVM